METAIVIGGGPAGLVAAAQLADAGVRTTLLEAKAGFGGRAASVVQRGFLLNQGPHALYVGGPAMRELRALGVDPPRWNPVSLTASVFLRDGAARRRLRPRALVGLTRLGHAALRRPPGLERCSAAEWIEREVDDPAGRELAAALVRVTTFAADHEALSADVAAQQLRLGAYPGVRYLTGGWQALVDALAVQAQRRGAVLHARSAVRALEPWGGGWVAATDAGEHEGDAVVVATGLPSDAASSSATASAHPVRPPRSHRWTSACACCRAGARSASGSTSRPTSRVTRRPGTRMAS